MSWWKASEPNDDGGEDCGRVQSFISSIDELLEDISCNDTAVDYFLCDAPPPTGWIHNWMTRDDIVLPRKDKNLAVGYYNDSIYILYVLFVICSGNQTLHYL